MDYRRFWAYKRGNIRKAPGMKYRHYAPKAPLTLVEGEIDQVVEQLTAWQERR